MKMTLQKKDIKLIIVLVGVLVLVIAYFAVFRTYRDKTDDLQSQIDSLQPELQQLREYDDHKQEYLDGIDAYKENAKSIMSSLPSSIWTEDQIMFLSMMEDDLDIEAQSEAFSDPTVLTQFSGTPLSDLDNYNDKVDMTAQKYQTTLSVNMDYNKFKDFIDYIYDEENMTGLDSVSLSYNAEDADLGISTVINQYSLSYDGAEEETHSVPEVSSGVSDPFGTISR
ncbi:MAG: hypothetical protein PUJ25_02080 [Lachnospiraceae bacterium]|nr:hypothetical protein [Lachnospiraceae bacterium]MDY4164671.1 hypothetical protein [Lachnospiraceae bacterium]